MTGGGEAWAIEPATGADGPALARCIEAAYAPYRAGIPDLPDVTDGIAEEIEAGRAWVVKLDGVIAGGMVLAPGERALRLVNLAIDPRFAGRGLGRALIARAEAEGRRLGFDQMRLTTHAEMPRTMAFYERLGWSVRSREGNAVRMGKRL